MAQDGKTSVGVKRPRGRRGFFQALAGAGAGAVTGLAGLKMIEGSAVQAAEVPPPLAEAQGNVLVRMQHDLERSRANGATPSYLMVVDTRKCIGCNACTIACRAENPTGPGAAFRKVVEKELPIGPRPFAVHKPMNCLQCDDPPCARAVLAGMITKRPDGIVAFDDRLRGPYATAAAQACPWGQIVVDDGRTFTQTSRAPQSYENRSFVEQGRVVTRAPGISTIVDSARKCTFCSHLLDVSVLPACVSTCIGGAMYFGDANLQGSLINEVTGGRRVFQGHQNQGVKPRVIYFEEPMPGAVNVPCEACHSR
jgi:Fe-S-cluster-containing dehydrogenase component